MIYVIIVLLILMQSTAAMDVTVDCDVEIKWTVLKKQPTQYDGK